MNNKKESSNKSQYLHANKNALPPIDKLLMPISIILSGVIISCSVLFAATMLKDSGLTEAKLKALLGANGGTANNGNGNPTGPSATIEQVKGLYKSGNVYFGDPEDNKVLFVEFADPSCPYCHAAAGKNPELNNQIGADFKLSTEGGSYVAPVPAMKKLVEEGKAGFVWIYTNGHGNGELGAQAMYCAHEKGKFWQVHDLLYSNKGYSLLNEQVKNDKAKAGTLADFTKDAVDSSFMKSCLESGKYASKLSEDQQTAGSLGVSGTPGYFVNTTAYAGAYNFTDMKATVDAALED